MTEDIVRHYRATDIADHVLEAVRADLAPGEALTAAKLAAIDHFHGRGLAATRELADMLKPVAGEHLLDIGCGIGGPARWLAETFDVRVTGVDLTPAFCAAARRLNEATGLAGKVAILEGNALALPSPDRTFDGAYSQNVVMNISDKRLFYAEAARVLKPGGRLALSNLAAGSGGAAHYPTPWAETAATSFLATPQETAADLSASGLEIVTFRDVTETHRSALAAMRAKLERDGLPRLGAHIFMGPRMREFQINSNRNIEEGRIVMLEILARRPE